MTRLRRRGDVDWQEAIRLRETGMSYGKIAERLGCAPSGVYYAVNHERIRRINRIGKQPARDPWTRDEVVARFIEHAERTGEPPRHSDLGKHGLPWSKTVERLFGTLNAALVAAGLPTRPVGAPLRWTPEAIAEAERQAAA
jgi:hypothetical protein